MQDGWRFLYDAAGLLPGVSRHEPETLSMAAAHAPGAPGFAERERGEDDRDRDRHRLWLLGIGPLCGRLPVTIRRTALGGTAPTPGRLKTGGNHRAGVEIRQICIGTIIGRSTLSLGKMLGLDCGSSVLQRDECREAARARSSNPITTKRACVRHKSKS